MENPSIRFPPLPLKNSSMNYTETNDSTFSSSSVVFSSPSFSSSFTSSLTSSTEYDFKLLDYKSSEEFLKFYLNKGSKNDNTNTTNSNTNNNNNKVEHLLNSITSQLKISRGLLALSMSLQLSLNKFDLINKLMNCSCALLDVEKVFYFEVSPNDECVFLKQNVNSLEMKQIFHGVECDVIASRKPVIIHDVHTNTRINSEVYKYLKIIPRNLICYPVILSNDIIGVLLVVNKLSVTSSFSSFDLWCLEYISSYVATAHLLKNDEDIKTLQPLHSTTMSTTVSATSTSAASALASASAVSYDQIDSKETIVHTNDNNFDQSSLIGKIPAMTLTSPSPNISPNTILSPSISATMTSTISSTALAAAIANTTTNTTTTTTTANIGYSSMLSSSFSPTTQTSIEHLIEGLINNAYHILHADKISLFLPNEQSNKLICTISRDIKGMQVSMDEGVVGQTLKSKVPIQSNNVREHIHHSNSMDNITGYNTISLLSYPILSKNGHHVYGVLQAINKNTGDGEFTTEDGAYLSNLCNYISDLISSQTNYLIESMNQNILKSIGDYSYSAAYNYRKHLYDNLDEYNEIRILELIAYCKLIGSCDQVLMYSLKSTPPTNEDDNQNESSNGQLELCYKESLSRCDSNSIINPISGEYGSVYSLPSYRENKIPKSVLLSIQNNLISQISLNELNGNGNPHNSSGNDNITDQEYLQSVNSSAAIIIPIHLLGSNNRSGHGNFNNNSNNSNNSNNNQNSNSEQENDSPIDVLIMLRSQYSSTPTPTSSQSFSSTDPYPSFSYLFNPSQTNFTSFQFEGINSLMKIFNSTYQLSINHREETYYQSLLENKINIMNETLIQLDTMYAVISSDGCIKLYNPSFEKFLGVPAKVLESILTSNNENSHNNQNRNENHNENQLIDVQLDKLFPNNNLTLFHSFKECMRSGKIVRENNIELKTYKYPKGVHVAYEIYEYYGNFNKVQTTNPSPRRKPTNSSKRLLQKFESFQFDSGNNNNSNNTGMSPLDSYGRQTKMFRISIRYLDKQALREVIQQNSSITENFPSYPEYAEENTTLDCLVHQTKDEVFQTPVKSPLERTSLSLSSSRPSSPSITSPRTKISPTRTLFKDDSTGNNSNSNNPELNNLFTWSFNALNVTSSDLQKYCAISIIEKNINITELNIPKSYFYNLISDIELNYYSNPFHNFRHAVCVLQCLFMLLDNTNYSSHLLTTNNDNHHHLSSSSSSSTTTTPFTTSTPTTTTTTATLSHYHVLLNSDSIYFTLLLSALFHDIRHPGNTNIYEIHYQSSRALLYNDVSVLENYHCSTAFHLMNLPKNNIFLQYTLKEKLLIRKVIISCILATDMAQHNSLIEQLNEKCQVYSNFIQQNNYQFIPESINEVIFYGKILLHCADLSNPVRPFLISKQWAELVSEEFNEQGKKEVYYNLPVSTFILSPDIQTLIKNEKYFCREIVFPLWNSFSNYFPSCSQLKSFVNQIHQNVSCWDELNIQKNE